MLNKTRLVPVDERIKIKLARNIVPKNIVEQFELTPDELNEYQKCSNEEELAQMCIKDALKNGSILLKKEVSNE